MKVITIALFIVIHLQVNAQLFSNNYMAQPFNAPKINTQKATVYTPGSGDYQYSHHPSIAFFKGKFFCIFSNGLVGEDEPGQRVAIATSTDFFNWSTVTALRDLGIAYELTPGGLLVANNNLLVAYYTQHDSTADFSHPNSRLYAVSTTDGVNWSAPVNLGVSIFPCHRPSILASGRLLLTGNRNFYYSDDPTGLSGWTLASNAAFLPGQTARLVEGAILEHTDSIYTLFRDAGKRWMWQESSKNGSSWSTPVRSAFTNDDTKAHFGKLPNGKSYYVGTPDTLAFGNRTPLVLSISDDGFNFNENYIIADDFYQIQYSAGRAKGGQFGYPYSFIKDDTMYVIASRRKEKVEIIRFALSELDSAVSMLSKDLSLNPQLDGTQLPLDAGWLAGTITSPASGSLTPNGEILINCTSGQSYSFQATPSSGAVFNPTGDYTIEFRLRVTQNNGRGIDIYTRDGLSTHTLLCIDTNRVFLNGSAAFHYLDATQYHTYRLVVKRDQKQMYFFIDGEFIRTVSRSNNTGTPQLLFGKTNAIAITQAYIDYLSYDLTGAYQPPAPPALELTLAQAYLQNKHLRVNWGTSFEQNCAYYEIALSADGKNFKKVGKVDSKAVNGFSNNQLDYEFVLPLHNMPVLGASFLMFLMAVARIGKRRMIMGLALLLLTGFMMVSCKKNKDRFDDPAGNLFLKIIQVDNQGRPSASKVIMITQ
ncbi:exo-alpha-sialidase [Niabella yanshanensis]|uniref:Exo-alpha-sialidase n=1 Tax=Niabella yanshanensis TaxID=577386 RepID=A0ABZ0W615_9BACT|nr:exo-alpha-sialidase [Niabella yanshanensis]WQD38566.1 exo-alpha-sialidase [Niabella yanshanensis]